MLLSRYSFKHFEDSREIKNLQRNFERERINKNKVFFKIC